MKIRPWVAKVFQCAQRDRQADDETIITFRNFANAPKTESIGKSVGEIGPAAYGQQDEGRFL